MKSLLLAAFLFVPLADAPKDPLEKVCPGGLCTIPKDQLQILLDAHNAQVEEIEVLRILLRNAHKSCRTT